MVPVSKHLITLGQASSEWLMDLQIESRSKATVAFYREFIGPFLQIAGAETPLENITSVTCKQYLTMTQDGHLHAHHARFRALRAFLNWCKRQDYIVASPLNVRPPKLEEKVIPDFRPGDLENMIRACQGSTVLRDKAMILLLYHTGIRLAELQRIQLADLDLLAHLLTIKGKNRKQRTIYLADEVVKAMWVYMRSRRIQRETVFLSEECNPLQTRGIYQAIMRVLKRAGVKGHPHVFRHDFASRWLQKGGSLDELQYILGHSSLAMVERYARASKAQRAVETHKRLEGS